MTYQSIIYDIEFMDANTFTFTCEDKAKLEMIHGNEQFKTCEGKYVKK